MALPATWQRLSLRERRMVALAGAIVAGALVWVVLWIPLTSDLARLSRDVPRIERMAAEARAQADDVASLARAAPPARAGDPLSSVERVLAERKMRATVSSLDLADGRLRMTLAMVRFDALPPLVDALTRSAGLVPVEVTLQPRVEAGFVRAEFVFGVPK